MRISLNRFYALTFLALASISWIAPPQVAEAQGNCGPPEMVLEQLADQYGEQVIALGIDAAGNLMEVWANLDTGTWTLTATNPVMLTCIVGSGASFDMPRGPPGDPA